MLENIEWGEFKLGDLFKVKGNPQLNKSSFRFSENGKYPYFTRTVFNNGIAGYVDYLDEKHKIKGNCLAIGMIGIQFFYMKNDFYAGQFTKRIIPKSFFLTEKIASYFISLVNKHQNVFQNTLVRDFEKTFNKAKIQLPVKNNKIDFGFINNFVVELEAIHIAELEADHIAELKAYLIATDLKNYNLTTEEEQILKDFGAINWKSFNLEKLYGKSTRGKRLKSTDRIPGKLPFITAGEANEGFSAFVGNAVEVFSENTTTIDMFGSAKYRNYKYGCDDHVAVVHTEKLSKLASIFVTTAIHKSSSTGRFDYSRNFYAKDADELNILLPVKDQQPDYETMEILISAIQKLVIKDVVLYAEKKIKTTKSIVRNKHSCNQ